MLDAFVSAELSGASNKEIRAAAKSAIDLANKLQHSRTSDFPQAAMCLATTSNVVQLISLTVHKRDSFSTLKQLIERYMAQKKLGESVSYALRSIARSELGHRVARDISDADVAAWVKERRKKVSASTALHDLTNLGLVLASARTEWGLSLPPDVVERAKLQLSKSNVIARSVPRRRLPTADEFERLRQYFIKQDAGRYSKTPMAEIAEFARWTARRVGEICSLRWEDFNAEKRTCILRGMVVNPKYRIVRDYEFPLVPQALEIVLRQPHTSDRIFPYHAKTASQRFTLAKKALGITGLTFNDLRRETARLLLSSGYDLNAVIKVTGRLNITQLVKEISWHQGPGKA